MENRYFAMAMGGVFATVGVLGFLPDFWTSPSGIGSGELLGMSATSLAHNVICLLLGIWGLAAFREARSSRMYARGLAAIYSALIVVSVGESLGGPAGMPPLVSLDIGLQIATAMIAAYFGWIGSTTPAPAMQYARRR